MFGHGCEPVGAGPVCVPLDPEDEDADGDGDELTEDDVAVVFACVAPLVPPPVAASATPVALAPTPAATMAVKMSRRARRPVLETICLLPSRLPPHVAIGSSSGTSLGTPTAGRPRPRSQRTLTCSRVSMQIGRQPAQPGPAVPPIAASGCRTRSPEPSRRPIGGGRSTGVPASVAPRAGPGPAQASTSASAPFRNR